MTFQSDLFNLLSTDITLGLLLTGGWFDAENLPRTGMTLDDAPKAVDGVSLRPFGVIRRRGMNDEGIRDLDAERGSIEIYLYADTGYAVIENAIFRLKQLLNRRFFYSSDVSLGHLQCVYVSGELMADELADAPFKFIRFNFVMRRQ